MKTFRHLALALLALFTLAPSLAAAQSVRYEGGSGPVYDVTTTRRYDGASTIQQAPAFAVINPDGTSVSATAVTATDRAFTGTGAAQTVMAANASRKGWCVQNPSANALSIQVREGSAATATTGYQLQPGASPLCNFGTVSQGIVSVLGANAVTYLATEYQ